ncbi:hypothetical protein [Streptomyces sp. TRM68416]|uniref:hypothetical protein n=1 Tax=Streptomyces sp. TRM68416 TaxID=2758412 RepID=UPI001661BF9A|nr:hypothetical protein [Streptomyces sp. TRM68416]MBD0844593.1 hypothetical protein [Streptomyces sp. TRM68416]
MRTFTKALVAASAAGLLTFSGASAYASDQTDFDNYWLSCQSGNNFKFKLYYNSNNKGAYADFGYAVGNFDSVYTGQGYKPMKFCNTGAAGSLQNVKNNAASAHNAHTSYGACVYYNSWFNGAKDSLPPATPVPTSKNLVNTYNDNASFQWC